MQIRAGFTFVGGVRNSMISNIPGTPLKICQVPGEGVFLLFVSSNCSLLISDLTHWTSVLHFEKVTNHIAEVLFIIFWPTNDY